MGALAQDGGSLLCSLPCVSVTWAAGAQPQGLAWISRRGSGPQRGLPRVERGNGAPMVHLPPSSQALVLTPGQACPSL